MSSDEEYFVDHIQQVSEVEEETHNEKSWYRKIQVANKNIQFKLDTGAEVNIISLEIVKNLKQDHNIVKTKIVLQVYGGFRLKPIGVIQLTCKHKDIKLDLNFVVVDMVDKCLLWLPACTQLNLIKQINNINCISDKQAFLEKNKDLFEGLGTFREELTIKMKPGALSTAKPPRRIPLAIKHRLKLKPVQMEKNHVIKKARNHRTG